MVFLVLRSTKAFGRHCDLYRGGGIEGAWRCRLLTIHLWAGSFIAGTRPVSVWAPNHDIVSAAGLPGGRIPGLNLLLPSQDAHREVLGREEHVQAIGAALQFLLAGDAEVPWGSGPGEILRALEVDGFPGVVGRAGNLAEFIQAVEIVCGDLFSDALAIRLRSGKIGWRFTYLMGPSLPACWDPLEES